MKLRLAILFTFCCWTTLFAQDTSNKPHWFVEAKVHHGKPVLYSDSLSESIQKPYSALDLRVGMLDRGRFPQGHYFHVSSFGLGFYIPKYHSDTIGNPYALYLYYNAPFVRKGKFSFNWELGVGLGWRFNEFHPIKNPLNDLVGSDKNIYASGNLFLAYELTQRMDLYAGLHFSHFSNGALNMPNKGFNMYGANMSLKYVLTKPNGSYRKEIVRPAQIKKAFYWSLGYGNGAKTTLEPWVNEKLYYAASLSTDLMYRYHWVGAMGFGFDYLYDGSLSNIWWYEGNNRPSDFTMLGIHIGHELDAGGLSLLFQMGTYLWRHLDVKGELYMRVGLKKRFTQHIYGTFALKTLNGFRADYFELGLGVELEKAWFTSKKQ